FLLGIAIVLSAALAACLMLTNKDAAYWGLPPPAWQLVLLILVLPFFVSLVTTDFISRWRRTRMFDRRSVSGRRPFIAGLVAVFLTVLFALISLISLSARDFPSDSMIVSWSAALGAGLTVLLLPRARTGHCVRCTYDLRGIGPSSAAATCPE